MMIKQGEGFEREPKPQCVLCLLAAAIIIAAVVSTVFMAVLGLGYLVSWVMS